ncbi:unannotated protein [freshwater metagenome]|uniref:Unannotated protein n=1 Tax=freshwater metagenome TaxID=449393 RepID=A0A6J7HBI2_9ZZZZ|nr:hypothetical protein [Actinomycetota bacterium]
MPAGDGETRDVRDVLGEHEHELLELERELRRGSIEDAAIARGGPVPAAAPVAAPQEEPPAAEAAPRRRWPLMLALALLLAAGIGVGVAALVGAFDSEDTGAGIVATPAAAARLTQTAPAPRIAGAADAARELCAGGADAAVLVETAADRPLTCPGITRLAATPVEATGYAHKGLRGRTCVSVPKTSSLDARADAALTARRAAAVAAAPEDSWAAGLAFDRVNDLRLLAVAPQPGAPCVVPSPATFADGTYPLLVELVAYGRPGTNAAQTAAAQVDPPGAARVGPQILRATVYR